MERIHKKGRIEAKMKQTSRRITKQKQEKKREEKKKWLSFI